MNLHGIKEAKHSRDEMNPISAQVLEQMAKENNPIWEEAECGCYKTGLTYYCPNQWRDEGHVCLHPEVCGL